MKKALVTGGAGFIGSHLCEGLVERGFRVVAVDDLSTGSLENLKALRGHPRFSFRKLSVLDRARLGPLVARCDVIYHLAAAVGVRLVLDRPVRSIRTNVDGAFAVLGLAADHRKKIVVASSSEVYGKPAGRRPMREDGDRLLGPTSVARWSYAESKAMEEYLALAYAREMKLPVVVTRFFNVVGPRQTGRYGMVLPRFIRQALRGEPLSVFGNGSQVRSFTYVKDAVRATIDLSLSKRAEGSVFNVGSNHTVTIAGLAAEVKRRTGSRSRIVRRAYGSFYGEGFEDAAFRVPDISRLRKAVGYRPAYDLARTLEETIAHYRGEGA